MVWPLPPLLVASIFSQARKGVLGRDASPGTRNKGPSTRGCQRSERTGQEEEAKNDHPDLTYAIGDERALGKGAESPPRLYQGTVLSLSYPRNPQDSALTTPISQMWKLRHI